MTGEKLYRLLYRILKIFHWSLFTVIVILVFWYTGGILFGISGMFLAPLIKSLAGTDYSHWLFYSFPKAGKALGAIAGIWFVKFILTGKRFGRPLP